MNALIAVYLVLPVMKTAFDSERKIVFKALLAVLIGFTVGKDSLRLVLQMVGSVTNHDFASTLNSLNEFYIFGSYGYVLLYFLVGGMVGRYLKQRQQGGSDVNRHPVFGISSGKACIGIFVCYVLTLLIHLGYLAFNQKNQMAYIPNEELRNELMDAVEENKWDEIIQFERQSIDLFNATINKDVNTVAAKIEQIHMEYTSVIQYNDENSLSSVLAIAYLGTMNYYFKPVRELPTGRGFADFVYIPKPEYINDYPALVVELKWNKNADTAMQQIRERQYPNSLLQYTGNILLVAINYDEKTKEHVCKIEEYAKIQN